MSFKYYIVPVIIIISTLAGCEKSKTGQKFYYRSADSMQVSMPVMYTSSGVITDQQKVAAFIKRRRLNQYFNLTSSTQPTLYGELHFLEDSKATFSMKIQGLLKTEVYTVRDKNTAGFLLASVDTLTYRREVNQGPLETFGDLVKSTENFTNCRIEGSKQNINACTYRLTIPFKVVNDDVQLPMFSFTISMGNTIPSTLIGPDIVGPYNPRATLALKPGDTLILQNKVVPFAKIAE